MQKVNRFGYFTTNVNGLEIHSINLRFNDVARNRQHLSASNIKFGFSTNRKGIKRLRVSENFISIPEYKDFCQRIKAARLAIALDNVRDNYGVLQPIPPPSDI